MKRFPVKDFNSALHFSSTHPVHPLKHSPTRPSPRKQMSEKLFFDSVREMSSKRSNNHIPDKTYSILQCAINTENTAEIVAKGYFKVNGILMRCNLLRSLDVCFTVQLEVVHTQQPWVIIVPITPSFQELNRIWKLRRRSSDATTLIIANWLISCLKFGFDGNLLTSTEFHNDELRKYVREALRNEIDAAATVLQACVRGYLIRHVVSFMRKHMRRITALFPWVSPPVMRSQHSTAVPQQSTHPLISLAEEAEEIAHRNSYRYVELNDNFEVVARPPQSASSSRSGTTSRERNAVLSRSGKMRAPNELFKLPPKSAERRIIDRQLTNMSELDMIFYDVIEANEEAMKETETALRQAEDTIRLERMQHEASLVLIRATRKLIRDKKLRKYKLENELATNTFLAIINSTTDYTTISSALQSSIDTGHATLCQQALDSLVRVLSDKATLILFKESKLRQNLQVLTDVGSNFVSNSAIVTALFRAVTIICAIEDPEIISSALGEAGIGECTVSVLKRHVNKREIVKECSKVLTKLIMYAVPNRLRVSSLQSCELYKQVLTSYIDDKSVLDKMIRFLTMLCVQTPTNQDTVGKSGLTHALVMTLKEHVTDADIVKLCARALQNFAARNHANNQYIIASYANCRIFVDALEAHVQKPSIVIQVTTLILSLCSSRSDIKVNFGGIGLADAVEAIMKSKTMSDKELEMLKSFVQKMSANASIKEEFKEAGIEVVESSGDKE